MEQVRLEGSHLYGTKKEKEWIRINGFQRVRYKQATCRGKLYMNNHFFLIPHAHTYTAKYGNSLFTLSLISGL